MGREAGTGLGAGEPAFAYTDARVAMLGGSCLDDPQHPATWGEQATRVCWAVTTEVGRLVVWERRAALQQGRAVVWSTPKEQRPFL